MKLSWFIVALGDRTRIRRIGSRNTPGQRASFVRANSSVAERLAYTEDVAGSNPASPTPEARSRYSATGQLSELRVSITSLALQASKRTAVQGSGG